MSGSVSHSAVGSALGYYYQAVYALKLLFDAENSNANVSIETLDDVFFEDGAKKELHQLKHSLKENSKISIKSDALWKTLRIWCSYADKNDVEDSFFVLSTVAEIDEDSPLRVLTTEGSDRNDLEKQLSIEADRVIQARKKKNEENENKIRNGEAPVQLPYETKYLGCIAFKKLDKAKRKVLLNKIVLTPGSFAITDAIEMVVSYIKITTQPGNHTALAKAILSWWDREAVESLTGERTENIFISELQEFISKKNSELFIDGFTDDLLDIEIPPITNPNPIHIKQLEIISATTSQCRRSFETEMKARIQRDKWMSNNLPSISRLKRYDRRLIEEWAYKFDDLVATKASMSDEQIKQKGRDLLDWTHNEAHQQILPISKGYSNPDLIRGSYQMLSTTKDVGWHCDYMDLIN